MKKLIAAAALLTLSTIAYADETYNLRLMNETDLALSISTQERFKTGEESLGSLCYAVGVGEVALTTAKLMKFDLGDLFKSFSTNESDFSVQLKKNLQFCRSNILKQWSK